MRFALTAKTLVRERQSNVGIREITARNVAKVTRYREGGEEELEKTVRRLETMRGLGKEAEEEEGGEGEDGTREPWETFARVRQRRQDAEDEKREKSAEEKSGKRRKTRDPGTGRRI